MKYFYKLSTVLLLIFFWLQYLLYYFNYLDMHLFYSILKVELFIFYVLSLYISISISNYTSSYTLFLVLSFIFLYGRIFLELFTDYQIKYTDLFSRIVLSNETEVKLLLVLINLLLFSLLAFLLQYKKNTFILKNNNRAEKIGKYLIIYLSLPLLIVYFQELIFVWKHGYLSLFNGELQKNQSLLSIVLPRLIFLSYLFFLTSIPKKNTFIKVTYLYILILFVDALKGQRGELLLMLVFFIWFYHHFYNKKIKILKYLTLTIIIMLFAQYMLTIRSNYDFNILNVPFEFLRLNGISLNVPAYIIEVGDKINTNSVPYFLAPLHDYFYRIFIDRDVFYNGPSFDLLNVSNNLSYHLTYYINSGAYYNGNGTGSSYVAELYDIGGIFISGFIMFGIVYFVITFENYAKKNRFILMLYFIILIRFLYMPRSSFLKFVDQVTVVIIFYFLINIFLYFTKRKKI